MKLSLPILKAGVQSLEITGCESLYEFQNNHKGQLSLFKHNLGDDEFYTFISEMIIPIGILFEVQITEPQLKQIFNVVKSDFWMLDITEVVWMFEGLKNYKFNKYFAGNFYPYIIEGMKEAHRQIWEAREQFGDQKHNETKEINIKPLPNEETAIGRE